MSSSPYIASDLSSLLLRYLEKQQLNAPEIRRELALFQNKTSARISYERWCGYIGQLLELTGNPCVGVEMGELMQLSYCGVLGHLALNCGTLFEALARFARYQELLFEGSGKPIIVGDKYRFCWTREREESFETQQSDEILIVGLLRLAKQLTGKNSLLPYKVGFMHPRPDYATKYKASLGNNVEFDQPTLFVELTIDFLSTPICDSNPTLIKLLDQQAEAMLKALPDKGEFDAKLREALILCMQNGTPSLNVLSQALCLSNRTLHRRLEERGLNFSLLLQKTRQELAIQYLREKRLSVIEISYLLGYSEQSAFARAFKQWTGKTPGRFQSRLSFT